MEEGMQKNNFIAVSSVNQIEDGPVSDKWWSA